MDGSPEQKAKHSLWWRVFTAWAEKRWNGGIEYKYGDKAIGTKPRGITEARKDPKLSSYKQVSLFLFLCLAI